MDDSKPQGFNNKTSKNSQALSPVKLHKVKGETSYKVSVKYLQMYYFGKQFFFACGGGVLMGYQSVLIRIILLTKFLQ